MTPEEMEPFIRQLFETQEKLLRNIATTRFVLMAMLKERPDGKRFIAQVATRFQAEAQGRTYDDVNRLDMVNGILLMAQLPLLKDPDEPIPMP